MSDNKTKEPDISKILLKEFDDYLSVLNRARAADDEMLRNFLQDPKNKPVKKASGGNVKSSNVDKQLYLNPKPKSEILRRYKTIAVPKLRLADGGSAKLSLKDLIERKNFLNSEIKDIGPAIINFPEMIEELNQLERLIKKKQN